ncbi:hypothetical protein MTO96_023168 [Rhipicephalus appendiculatus]
MGVKWSQEERDESDVNGISGGEFVVKAEMLVKGFGVTSTVSPVERKVRRLCDEVAEEDARPTPLSVELVGVVRPVRPSVFATGSFQASSGSGETVVTMQPAFHFPWTPDEKGAFKKVSSAAGVIGCVDGSVAVIIAPKGDHHKAASYCCKKHYADIVMLSGVADESSDDEAGVATLHRSYDEEIRRYGTCQANPNASGVSIFGARAGETGLCYDFDMYPASSNSFYGDGGEY